MADGSTYSVVKAAMVTLLQARDGLAGVAVSYQAPVNVPDVRSTGSWEAVFLDDAEGSLSSVVFCGPNALRWDEDYVQRLVIQVLRPTATGTQQACDGRVEDLLYEVLAVLAAQHSWDRAALGLDAFDLCQVTPTSQRWVPGFLEGTPGHASRLELGLRVRARRGFTA